MNVLKLTTLDGEKRNVNMERACYWGDITSVKVNGTDQFVKNHTRIWFDANNWIAVLEKTNTINILLAEGRFENGS